MHIKETDFLVIGSGIAGLTFANKVSQQGHVLIITKKRNIDSNTNYAQGGIAAVFGSDDSFESHIEDTVGAGEGLCDHAAVRTMVREGPGLITELYEMGCQFTTHRDDAGRQRFDLGKEGGHSKRRIVHAHDFTGREIERVLVETANRTSSIELIENGLVLDLIVKDNECLGTYYYDYEKQALVAALSRVTFLATGGCGQIYRFTTNPPIATGDGIAIAYRAGARIANMEFVQFHPTAVYDVSIEGRAFLVSEATRGEGGVLKTRDGKTFMEKYHPLGGLAPRDVVARACYAEMKRRGDEYCLLDLTHLQGSWVRSRFPVIYETLMKHGIDITKEAIPVVPVAHYLCGGIKTDIDAHSSIGRLFAAGEAACSGVHGANRLASNSLLEALVFASRASRAALTGVFTAPGVPNLEYDLGRSALPDYIDKVKETMHRCGGIVRNQKDLGWGIEQLAGLLKSLPVRLAPEDYRMRNMGQVGLLVLRSAIARRESRGLHCMEEFPLKNPALEKETIIDDECARLVRRG